MLYHFLFPLADEYIIFNLFKYLTFRTGGAILTALIISFIIGPSMIQWLRGQQVNGQPIRDDGPETHLAKRGTPTMGGLMILVALMVSTLLWADIFNPYIWLVSRADSGQKKRCGKQFIDTSGHITPGHANWLHPGECAKRVNLGKHAPETKT